MELASQLRGYSDSLKEPVRLVQSMCARLLVDVAGLAVRDIELVHAALRADGFIEQRAHRAVADENCLG